MGANVSTMLGISPRGIIVSEKNIRNFLFTRQRDIDTITGFALLIFIIFRQRELLYPFRPLGGE